MKIYLDPFAQHYPKYLAAAVPFVINRLTFSYHNRETFKVKAFEAILFGFNAALNEFLIDTNVTENYSYSYLPYVASYTFRQNLFGKSIPAKLALTATATIATKVAYDLKEVVDLFSPVITYFSLNNLNIDRQISSSLAIVSLAEEISYYNSNNSNHYIPYASIGAVSANTLLKNTITPKPLNLAFGCISGFLAANYKKELTSFLFPTEIIADSYNISSSLIHNKQINTETEKLLLVSVNLYFSAGTIGNHYMRQEQALMNTYFGLANNQENLTPLDLKNYKSQVIFYIVRTAIPFLTSRILIDSINSYFVNELKIKLKNELTKKFLDTKNYLTISNEAKLFSSEYMEDIDNIVDRIFLESLNSQDYGIINDLAYITPKLFLMTSLKKGSLMILPLTLGIDYFYKHFYQFLIDNKQQIIDANKNIRSLFDQNEQYDRNFASELIQKGNLDNVEEHWLKWQNTYDDNKFKIYIYSKILDHLDWIYNFEISYNLLRYGVSGLIYYKTIGPNDLFLYTVVLKSFSDFISFRSKHQADIESIESSTNRLNEVFKIIDTDHNIYNKIDFDINNDLRALEIKNLSFTRGNEHDSITINLNDIQLHEGNVYALIGSNGSGKSSLMSLLYYILNGITDLSYKDLSGQIIYPSDDFVIVPQKDYCPYNVSLLELILYPTQCNQANNCNGVRPRILSLLEEMNLNYGTNELTLSTLEERNDNWCNVLSGGQLKKVFLTKQFIDCPKILFLDETLAPLDQSSRTMVTSKIKKGSCFNESIVIITHHDNDLFDIDQECPNSDFFDYTLQLNNNHLNLNSLSGFCQEHD